MPKAALWGLVLAGGRSSRMGEDKGRLSYHGVDQLAYCRGLLAAPCETVALSRGRGQAEVDWRGEIIFDEPALPVQGPAAGLLAARRFSPRRSWLALACDMPGVDAALVALLVSARDPGAGATAFRAADGRPEPLFAIWEPQALRVLEARARRGVDGPRGALEAVRCRLIDAPRPDRLKSVDTPLDRRSFPRA